MPTAASLPQNVVGSAREAFEGMLVRPTGTASAPYRVVSSHNLLNFGELWTSAPPVAASSACAPPGPHAGRGVREPAARQRRRRPA